MLYELISEDEYERLPEDPSRKFVVLEQICRKNMNSMITQDTSADYDQFVRLQYMTLVAAAAEELGISGLTSLDVGQDGGFAAATLFMIKANAASMRIRLSSPGENAYAVKLAPGSKGRIMKQVEVLRQAIAESDFPEARKSRLRGQLHNLEVEINQTSVSYAKVMTAITVLSCGIIVKGTEFLANAPQAIATIHSILGEDKESEKAAIKRLAPSEPRKALPAPNPSKPQLQVSRMSAIDDDIPF